jgi:hypothetical protein
MNPPTSLWYWLRWEVVVCLLLVTTSLGLSALLIWTYEAPRADRQTEPDAGDAGTRPQSPEAVDGAVTMMPENLIVFDGARKLVGL